MTHSAPAAAEHDLPAADSHHTCTPSENALPDDAVLEPDVLFIDGDWAGGTARTPALRGWRRRPQVRAAIGGDTLQAVPR